MSDIVNNFIKKFKNVDVFSGTNFFYMMFVCLAVAAYEYNVGHYPEYGFSMFLTGVFMGLPVSLSILILKR